MDDLSEVMIISLNGVFIAPLCLLLNEKADRSVQKATQRALINLMCSF